jgi:predicted alpha-1,2-mannosidase
MKNFFFVLLFCIFTVSLTAQFTQFVNPFIGTDGHGHTYPGATVPFGMVQLSPDTRADGYNDWDGCSGYHYSDSLIYGFSHTHLSGTGIADYCDVLLMPVTTPDISNSFSKKDAGNTGYASKFKHKNETSTPGYYSVLLDDDNIQVELTASLRTGFHKYFFPKTNHAAVLLDLTHRDKLLEGSYIKVLSEKKVEGLRRSSSWAVDQWLYFAIEFSEPFALDSITAFEYGFRFGNKREILVKCALSAVSAENAWENMQAEIPGWDFTQAKNNAREVWEKQLAKIEVHGGSHDDKVNFYTALYHTMIVPNIYEDVDGSFRGRDNEILNTKHAFHYYTVFSLWDTYRATHPLYTILEQKKTADFINTFLKQYELGGRLPMWELSANETHCMIGYHSVSVLADAITKEIQGFDYAKCYEAAREAQTLNPRSYRILYDQLFFESNDESESVSKTLEYAYDDWCIAQIGKTLNEGNHYNYIYLSKKWMHLFDGEFIRPRFNGGWYEPFDPAEVNFNYTEANAWQYTFYAPHDLGSLFPPEAGKANVTRLDRLFTASPTITGRQQSDITGMIGQYAHGNEPSHHVAYLYNYVQATHKTQYYVNKIRKEFYKNAPDGLIGNEDCGQMSAWYVFSALGFYPVCPGKPIYDAGTPLFDSVKIHLENGKTCNIISKNKAPANIYVKSISVNATPLAEPVIHHADIINGGTILFEMTDDSTITMSGTTPEAIPSHIPLCPIIQAEKTFADSTLITIIPFDSTETILYNFNGENPLVKPSVYNRPFYIRHSANFLATAKTATGSAGKPSTAIFKKITASAHLTYIINYDNQYTGGGNLALLDGIRGLKDFRTGSWQGWQGANMELLIDLGETKRVNAVRAGFLQDVKSWIFMPVHVKVLVSADGENFIEAATIPNTIAADDYTPTIKEFAAGFSNMQARYIKLIAENTKTVPAWHPGAGGRAWIFCDEVSVD